MNVVIQEQVSPDSNDAQTELEKETRKVSLGWTSDTANVHDDVLFMDVSDVQISDEDGYLIVMLTSTTRSKRTARL